MLAVFTRLAGRRVIALIGAMITAPIKQRDARACGRPVRRPSPHPHHKLGQFVVLYKSCL